MNLARSGPPVNAANHLSLWSTTARWRLLAALKSRSFVRRAKGRVATELPNAQWSEWPTGATAGKAGRAWWYNIKLLALAAFRPLSCSHSPRSGLVVVLYLSLALASVVIRVVSSRLCCTLPARTRLP